jgi:hypothetical protein
VWARSSSSFTPYPHPSATGRSSTGGRSYEHPVACSILSVPLSAHTQIITHSGSPGVCNLKCAGMLLWSVPAELLRCAVRDWNFVLLHGLCCTAS